MKTRSKNLLSPSRTLLLLAVVYDSDAEATRSFLAIVISAQDRPGAMESWNLISPHHLEVVPGSFTLLVPISRRITQLLPLRACSLM